MPETVGPNTAFLCLAPLCGRAYGDPMYQGPAGHCPRGICLDCWEQESEARRVRRWKEQGYSDLELMLLCVASGWTQQQAATLVGKSPRTLRRWYAYCRKNPGILARFVSENLRSRVRTL